MLIAEPEGTGPDGSIFLLHSFLFIAIQFNDPEQFPTRLNA